MSLDSKNKSDSFFEADDDSESDHVNDADTFEDILKQQKEEKLKQITLRENQHRDTIMRKMPRKMIKENSYNNQSPTARASVLKRLDHNEEIVNAQIRQAQRKASAAKR